MEEVKDRYAVRRKLRDTKHQLGLFCLLNNAKKLALKNPGYKVYDIETGALVYEPTLTRAKRYVAALREMNDLMLDDLAEGLDWVYSNGSIPKAKTFAAARRTGKRALNCVDGVQWGLLKAGVVGDDRSAIQWYGAKGFIRWCNSHAEADAKRWLNIIDVGGKTVMQCYKEGILQPGDILTYLDATHTNAYVGGKKSFDSGHYNCTPKTGDGAKFYRWICPLAYGNNRINKILRLKEEKAVHRVQVGAYKTLLKLRQAKKTIKNTLGLDCFYEKEADGLRHLYCGSFDSAVIAEDRKRLVQTVPGFEGAFVRDMTVLV